MARELRQMIGRYLRGLPRTPRELARSLALLDTFRADGWQRSATEGAPVTPFGEPLPWFSYSAIHWLEQYIQSTHRVYEFGAGHSTLWFASRALRVSSVESDADWLTRLQSRLPANATVTLIRSEGGDDVPSAYARSILEQADASLDVIVIDGKERGACADLAPAKLAPGGLIVFDNSDRPRFHPGLLRLQEQGFARVDFIGPMPGAWYPSCTSVLFRELAVLARPAVPRFLGF